MDRVKGSAQQAKGAVKEVVGKVTGDAKLESEGKGDKVAGKIQNAVGGLKDSSRQIVGQNPAKANGVRGQDHSPVAGGPPWPSSQLSYGGCGLSLRPRRGYRVATHLCSGQDQRPWHALVRAFLHQLEATVAINSATARHRFRGMVPLEPKP
jgi:uncharacterized protein YjbJ (UPF0337 family)